jgi:hypothetical protein
MGYRASIMWLASIFRPMQIVLAAIDNKDSKAALYVAVLVCQDDVNMKSYIPRLWSTSCTDNKSRTNT